MKPWSFIHATDIHVGSARSFRFAPAWNENWQTARKQIVDFNPDMLLVGGDLTRDGSVPEHTFEFENIKADLDALPLPYHVTPGNMDTGNKHADAQGASRNPRDDISLNLTSAQLVQFQRFFGHHCWTFMHKNVRFSSFCDMVAGSGLPEEPALWKWLEAQVRQPRAPYHVWMIHSALFIDHLDEPDFDIQDPNHYHDWYFAIDLQQRLRIMEILKATGATLVLSGHVHCRKRHRALDIDFHINPSTAFSQWGTRWPDGDDALGFVRYDVTQDGIEDMFIPLDKRSTAQGYGPGGHPTPDKRDYSLAK